jgi:hypothetical protein
MLYRCEWGCNTNAYDNHALVFTHEMILLDPNKVVFATFSQYIIHFVARPTTSLP